MSPVRTTDILVLGFNPERLDTRNKIQGTRNKIQDTRGKRQVSRQEEIQNSIVEMIVLMSSVRTSQALSCLSKILYLNLPNENMLCYQ